jgi:hypothetical protein
MSTAELDFLVSSDDFTFGTELGHGRFGTVYLCTRVGKTDPVVPLFRPSGLSAVSSKWLS